MTETRSLFGSAGGIFALRVAAAGATYLTQVVLARWLGASALGTYVLAASLLIVLSTLSAFGLPSAAPRFLPRYAAREDWTSVRRYLSFSRVVAVGLGAAVAGGGWLLRALGLLELPDASLAALTGVPLFAMLLVNSGFAHGLRHHYLSAAFSSSLSVGLLVVVAAMWGLDAAATPVDVVVINLALILGVVVVQVVVLARLVDRAAGDAVERSREPGAPRRRQVGWLRSSSGLLLVGLTSSYLSDVVVLAAGTAATPAEVAVLNAVLRTATLLLFVGFAVDHVVAPEFSRFFALADDLELRRAVLRATRVRLAAIGACAVGLVVTGPVILGLFGPGFDEGYLPLVVALGGLVVRGAAGGAPRLVAATSGTKPLVAASFAGVAVGLGLALVTVRASSVMGGAVAFGSAMATTAWLSRSICIRRLGLDPSILGLLSETRRT